MQSTMKSLGQKLNDQQHFCNTTTAGNYWGRNTEIIMAKKKIIFC